MTDSGKHVEVVFHWSGLEEYFVDRRLVHRSRAWRWRGSEEFDAGGEIIRIEFDLWPTNIHCDAYVNGELKARDIFPDLARDRQVFAAAKGAWRPNWTRIVLAGVAGYLIVSAVSLALPCLMQPECRTSQWFAALLKPGMLENVCWSFAEPVPETPEAFRHALEEYGAAISCPVPWADLQASLPFDVVDVRFEHYRQLPDGEWEAIEEVVRIRASAGQLTGLDLLYQLHRAAHPFMQDQDAHYFEGLGLGWDSGGPLYDVVLGS